jgi:hypothetical protein
MEILHRRCCGLDVHKETVVAGVRLVSDGKVTTEVRTFQTTTADLLHLFGVVGGKRLRPCGHGGGRRLLEARVASRRLSAAAQSLAPPPVRYLIQARLGGRSAENFLRSLVRGEWLTLLDTDRPEHGRAIRLTKTCRNSAGPRPFKFVSGNLGKLEKVFVGPWPASFPASSLVSCLRVTSIV